ncbi:hypothetical protein BJX99DRAFT_243278 [Aspergillus californicus]
MNPLYPLEPVDENIWLYEPPTTDDLVVSEGNPAIIVLCTWLGGATPRRIAKYVSYHRQVFPQSAILLLTTGMIDMTLRSSNVIRTRLKPARQAIRQILGPDAGDFDKNPNGVLLHIFSHGGSNIAIQLLLSMQDPEHPSGIHRLPLQGIIFDSCPGDTTFMRNYQASVYSLPPAPLPIQMLNRALLFPAIGVITGLQSLGITSSISEMQKQLNDTLVISARVPRLYLFSKADTTICWEEVQTHLDDARVRGFNVASVVFHTSPHCALIVEDEKRYWGAVQQFWEHIAQALAGVETLIPTYTVDLISLDTLEIAKRAHVPPADVRRLSNHVIKALHHDVGFEEAPRAGQEQEGQEEEPDSGSDLDRPLIPGPRTKLELSWCAISTLDPKLDSLLNGGILTGYLTEITGESGSGKTQFLLNLLLAVQLPPPRGAGRSAIYISTEAPLATNRLSQLIESHPYLSTLSRADAPSLQKILSINAMDLESQDHILNYQLPVAIQRYNVGLVVIDSITSNYRAEHTSHDLSGLSTRSGELAKLGQMLRNLAAREDIAIVVANQVSDRFEAEVPLTFPRVSGVGGNDMSVSSSPATQRDERDSGAVSPVPRMRPLEQGNVELNSIQHTLQVPQSTPNIPSSSPLPTQEDQQQQFDGTYIVGNPVRNEILSLQHQQRFFTGWGDTQPVPTSSPFSGFQRATLKTPTLGLVWSTQIACRIALKGESQAETGGGSEPDEPQLPKPLKPDNGENPSRTQPADKPSTTTAKDATAPPSQAEAIEQPVQRAMKLVFSPWAGGSVHGESGTDEVKFEIWKGGMRAGI